MTAPAEPEGDWYQRMATRSAQRSTERHKFDQAHSDREWRRMVADSDRLGRASQAGITLGEAVQLLNAPPWACACIGPPHCCRYAYDQARALHRGAHITARLLTDASAGGVR